MNLLINILQHSCTIIFFSSFDEDQLANIHWYRWNERLKITERTTFKADTSKASEEIFPRSREILQTFVCCRARICPDHTNVCKFSATLQGNIFVISLNIFYFFRKILCWCFFFFRIPSVRPPLAYNRLDEEHRVNRASHMGPYRVIDGLPL